MQANSPNPAEQLRAVALSLLPEGTAVATTLVNRAQPDLWPEEAAAMVRAFPTRRREFAAGRAMARDALTALGHAPTAIPQAPDRAPVWPQGIAGSISHSDLLCVAALSTDLIGLGIDIEPNRDLEPNLITTICSDAEVARLPASDLLRLAKLTFCAKEAAYKAQYPITREILDFSDFDVTFDFKALRFAACFTRQVGPFREGDRLDGQFGAAADHLVTTLSIGQGA